MSCFLYKRRAGWAKGEGIWSLDCDLRCGDVSCFQCFVFFLFWAFSFNLFLFFSSNSLGWGDLSISLYCSVELSLPQPMRLCFSFAPASPSCPTRIWEKLCWSLAAGQAYSRTVPNNKNTWVNLCHYKWQLQNPEQMHQFSWFSKSKPSL